MLMRGLQPLCVLFRYCAHEAHDRTRCLFDKPADCNMSVALTRLVSLSIRSPHFRQTLAQRVEALGQVRNVRLKLQIFRDGDRGPERGQARGDLAGVA